MIAIPLSMPVRWEEELTFNGEKIISHAKPNKRAEEQELFGLPDCS